MPAFPLWNAGFLFFRGCGDDFGYLIKFSDLYTIETIADIIGARSFIQGDDTQILYLQTDSRRINFPAESLFFAIRRSEEHTSELQSLMRISYAVFCLNNKKKDTHY